MNKTIIVSNRLPVKISEGIDGPVLQPSEGGLATALASVHQQAGNRWIGWPGLAIEDPAQQAHFTSILQKKQLVPIYLTDEEINGFYEGFSNEVLWPIFHYTSTYANYDIHNWATYKRVNERFRDAVLEQADATDTIWIHDYQLLLLPGLIREALPDATIAFFQHIPFPSQELLRLIPWRAELLAGMLGADLLGFHTFDDVRHFVSSATRLTPIHNRCNRLEVDGRAVFAEPYPIGVDSEKFSRLSANELVQNRAHQLKQNFKGQKIILSIDRLDYSKGIIQRLEALDLLFSTHPEYLKKITLYMVVVPSRDTVPEYRKLKEHIDQLVGNINGRHGTFDWYPIAYFYHSYPVEEITALYNIADICLVTPMRDGMNLVCKEYVACRHNLNGILILSEMAGASKELIDALIVNPNDIHDIRNALLTALNMSGEEEQRRMKNMRSLVFKFTVQHWAKLFMNRLDEIKSLQESTKARLVGMEIKDKIIAAYKQSSSRLLLLDYDGTLVGFQDDIDKAFPDHSLHALLNELNHDASNHVVIISGRKHQTLDNWFKETKCNLIAEHGVWTKSHGADWRLKPGLSNRWKAEIAVLMESYADRTPGAFVEEKS